jgi:hypothetical protein
VIYDKHFAERDEGYQKQRAELVAEVMNLFEATKKDIAEERGTN